MNDKDRVRLLEILAEAPVDILAQAAEEYLSRKLDQSNILDKVYKYFGRTPGVVETSKPNPVAKKKSTLPPSLTKPIPPRPNSVEEAVSMLSSPPLRDTYGKPPGEATSRVSSDVEAKVVAWLKNTNKASLSVLAKAIDRPDHLAEKVLARLWDKKVVKYNQIDKVYELNN